MGLQSNWRTPATAEDFASHDFADFAQEFLRRNTDYKSDHERTEKMPLRRDEAEARDAIANKWGLVLPFRSKTPAAQFARILASRCKPGRSHAYSVNIRGCHLAQPRSAFADSLHASAA